MTKEDALAAAKAFADLDEKLSGIATLASNEREVVAALTGWICLNGVRQSLIRLVELSGVDIEKELLPDLPMGRPVVVLPHLMKAASLAAAGLGLRQAGVPPLAEPKMTQ